MKVLIADKFEKVGIDGLKELGCTVVSQPDVKAEDLPAAIKAADPHILIVRSKKVNADALKAGTALTLVIRAGAGIDTIDVATASNLGVFVSNCPGKNSIAVAELAMGLLLACDRRIPDQTAELRHGAWNKGEFAKARGLHGRTLGIVGLGQIGREIATRARAFGMRVIGWSRSLTHDEADRLGIIYAQTPLEVARQADAVVGQRGGQQRHQAPGERRVPGGDASRRLSHQHVARVGGGRGGPRAGDRREEAPRGARRVREGARGEHRRPSPTRS